MAKIHKTELLTRLIRISGTTRNDVAEKMGISVATLRKYLSAPDTMNGIRRKELAKAINVKVAVIDYISNLPSTLNVHTFESLINTINTLNNNQHNGN